MNNKCAYINAFFDQLAVYEDVARGHYYKIFMRQSILDFLEHETPETAFAVYRTFFDSYRITLAGNTNPFIDLLDILLNYEEKAAVLIDKQRDHYVHSVNVFILGLCIYTRNANYRKAFNQKGLDKQDYPYAYSTNNEEFYYRWGIASLFHDVGYPIEIVGRQINKFVDFITMVDANKERVNVQLNFENFTAFNQIPEIIPKREFTKCYYDHFADSVYIDLLKPLDLLAHRLHRSLGVDLKTIKKVLDEFPAVMADKGFIDHGYFSSIIVLRWYGYLIQSAKYRPEYFFWPILDSASAILLHNYYRNIMIKEPFDLGPLKPETHPLAFLLILCDELQEWNRTAYGIKDKLRTLPTQAELDISDAQLSVTFISINEPLADDFAVSKRQLLEKLLDIDALFSVMNISCQVQEQLPRLSKTQRITPRPELKDLEQLAKAIHDLYNEKQRERNPGKSLRYPDFDHLPDSIKYSNFRQAMDIPEKLKLVGMTMRPAAAAGRLDQIPDQFIEFLAEREHESWLKDRISTGWVLGSVVDADKKTSPYLIPYDALPEDIKQLDRDTVINIPLLLKRINMGVYPDS